MTVRLKVTVRMSQINLPSVTLRYESLYSWLCYKQSEKGYMCKICDIYYGASPCPSGGIRGAWSHKAVTFHADNAGNKLRRHEKNHINVLSKQ